MSDINKEFVSVYGEKLDREIDAVIAEANERPHEFSKEFEDSMQELINSGRSPAQKAKRIRARRIAFIAVAAVLALAATACAVPEIRNSIAGFFVRIFSDHVEYSDPEVTKEKIEEYYELVPVPNDYSKSQTIEGDTTRIINYENSAGQIIALIQSVDSNLSHSIDSDNGEYNECEINNIAVMVYSSGETRQASWIENGYYFSLTCPSSINEEQFFKMIGSVKEG